MQMLPSVILILTIVLLIFQQTVTMVCISETMFLTIPPHEQDHVSHCRTAAMKL
jgi:hypothetical protein